MYAVDDTSASLKILPAISFVLFLSRLGLKNIFRDVVRQRFQNGPQYRNAGDKLTAIFQSFQALLANE